MLKNEPVALVSLKVGQAFVLQTSENYTGPEVAFIRIADMAGPVMHITALDVENLKVHHLINTMLCFPKDCMINVSR